MKLFFTSHLFTKLLANRNDYFVFNHRFDLIVSNILSGLKTKSINIPGSGSGSTGNDMSLFGGASNAEEKGSTISISELKDLQNDRRGKL